MIDKGILGTKLGMTQIFEDTRAVPVTVIQAGPVLRRAGEDEGDATATRPSSSRSPSRRGRHQADAGPLRRARRPSPAATSSSCARTTPSSYSPGQELTADMFAPGERADVVGVSKGKGFSRRHEAPRVRGPGRLATAPRRKHRSPGSIGACATPVPCLQGHADGRPDGNQRVTVLNLEVVQADPERNLLLVKGAVPGPNGGLVMVRSAVKAPAEAARARASDGLHRRP